MAIFWLASKKRIVIIFGIFFLFITFILLSKEIPRVATEEDSQEDNLTFRLRKLFSIFRSQPQSAISRYNYKVDEFSNCKISPEDEDDEEISQLEHDQDYCPGVVKDQVAAKGHISRRPTVILLPLDGGLEDWDAKNRTSFMPILSNSTDRSSKKWLSSIGFLGWTHGDKNLPNGPKRFKTSMSNEDSCPVFRVAASNPSDNDILDHQTSRIYLPSIRTSKKNLGCISIKNKNDLGYRFGFSTSSGRALEFIPIWNDWIRSKKNLRVEGLLVLTNSEGLSSSYEQWKTEMIGKGAGFNLRMKYIPEKRDEFRYFLLIKHLWSQALEEEEIGQTRTDWFSLACVFSIFEKVKQKFQKHHERKITDGADIFL